MQPMKLDDALCGAMTWSRHKRGIQSAGCRVPPDQLLWHADQHADVIPGRRVLGGRNAIQCLLHIGQRGAIAAAVSHPWQLPPGSCPCHHAACIVSTCDVVTVIHGLLTACHDGAGELNDAYATHLSERIVVWTHLSTQPVAGCTCLRSRSCYRYAPGRRSLLLTLPARSKVHAPNA